MSIEKQKRIIFAPQPVLFASSQLPSNRLIKVEIDDSQDVQWLWTSLPDGTRFVSGYTIVEKQN